MVDSSDSLLLGSTLGKYSFKYRIGNGATSEIWKCEEIGKGPVAAKFISRTRPYYKELVEYTKGEYDFYRSVNHASLPKAYDVFENSRGYFMIMDLIDGLNLLQAFQVNRAQYQPLLPVYVKKIIEVMDYVHKQKVIHCDIKPENFMVDLKGNVWLIDFSLLKKPGFSFSQLFSKPKIEGTPEYMSPEQIRGKSITYLSDFYSLGLVLYFLYTGKKAFEGESPEAILNKNLHDTPIDPYKLNPDICCTLMNSIIKQLIAKKPQERIQSLVEVQFMFRKTRLASQ